MIIGLTGGIGSGKSTVAQLFRELGIVVIDSDQITRQLVAPKEPALAAIVKQFGSEILQKDGTLDRARLRSRIFEFPNDRLWLEQLLHPLVKKIILQHASKTPPQKYTLVEIPLLIEANFEDAVDRILVVDSTEADQIQRVGKRDGLSPKEIEAMIKSQSTRSNRLTKADDVIENMGNLEALKQKVLVQHHYYIELSR